MTSGFLIFSNILQLESFNKSTPKTILLHDVATAVFVILFCIKVVVISDVQQRPVRGVVWLAASLPDDGTLVPSCYKSLQHQHAQGQVVLEI